MMAEWANIAFSAAVAAEWVGSWPPGRRYSLFNLSPAYRHPFHSYFVRKHTKLQIFARKSPLENRTTNFRQ